MFRSLLRGAFGWALDLASRGLLYALGTGAAVGLIVFAVAYVVIRHKGQRMVAAAAEDEELGAELAERAKATNRSFLRFGAPLFAAIGAGLLWWAASVEPVPNRILLVPTVAGEPATELLGPSVGIAMGAVGLDVFAAEEGVEDVEGTAVSTGASYLVFIDVRLGEERHLPGEMYSDFDGSAHVRIVHVDRSEEVVEETADFMVWGENFEDALLRHRDKVAERIGLLVVPVLARQPEIQELAAAEARGVDDVQLKSELEKLVAAGNRIETERDAIHQLLQDLDEPVERAPTAMPHKRVSLPNGLDGFVGARPDGSIVVDATLSKVVVRLDQLGYRAYPRGDSLVVISADGNHHGALWVYNFFSEPSLSADGGVAAAVIDDHGIAKTVALVDIESGDVQSLAREELGYYSTPVVSPDASRVVVLWREARDAPSEVRLLDTSGRYKTLLPAQQFVTTPVWAPDGRQIYICAGDSEGMKAYALDPEAGVAVVALPPEPPELVDLAVPPPDHGNFERVAVGHTSKKLYAFETREDEERGFVVVFDRDDGSFRRLFEATADQLVAAPHRDALAISGHSSRGDPNDPSSSDREVYWLDLETASVRQVTVDSIDNDLAGWSHDGAALYVHERQRAAVAPRGLQSVYRYELPAVGTAQQ